VPEVVAAITKLIVKTTGKTTKEGQLDVGNWEGSIETIRAIASILEIGFTETTDKDGNSNITASGLPENASVK